MRSTRRILRTIDNLPEELQLTEHEWYKYHYYKKRNMFLFRNIPGLPYKARRIYVVEPHETYIGEARKIFGFYVDCEHFYPLEISEIAINAVSETAPLELKTIEYDVILLLNAIDHCQDGAENSLKKKSSLLK